MITFLRHYLIRVPGVPGIPGTPYIIHPLILFFQNQSTINTYLFSHLDLSLFAQYTTNFAEVNNESNFGSFVIVPLLQRTRKILSNSRSKQSEMLVHFISVQMWSLFRGFARENQPVGMVGSVARCL